MEAISSDPLAIGPILSNLSQISLHQTLIRADHTFMFKINLNHPKIGLDQTRLAQITVNGGNFIWSTGNWTNLVQCEPDQPASDLDQLKSSNFGPNHPKWRKFHLIHWQLDRSWPMWARSACIRPWSEQINLNHPILAQISLNWGNFIWSPSINLLVRPDQLKSSNTVPNQPKLRIFHLIYQYQPLGQARST